jgi:hypothetical protein
VATNDHDRFTDRLRHAQTFMAAAVQALEEAAELSDQAAVQASGTSGPPAFSSEETLDLVEATGRQVREGCERLERLLEQIMDGDKIVY